MPRIRTIKPEFPQSESMGRISREARLLFILLWTICDDAGRTRAASRMLASTLYPYDDDVPKRIGAWLAELEAEHCIRLYHVEGDTYLEIVKWLKHQKIDRPSPSRLPQFDEASRAFASIPRGSDADLVPGPSTLDLVPSTAQNANAGSSSRGDFEIFWLHSPRKVGKGSARKAYRKALTKTSPEILLAGITAHAVAMSGKDETYIPYPATWLNQERWNDQPASTNGNGIYLSERDAPKAPPPPLKGKLRAPQSI